MITDGIVTQTSQSGTKTGTGRQYAIIRTRYWYGPDVTRALVTYGGHAYTWSTYREARKWIKRDRDDYILSHNECLSPHYSIVEVGSQRFCRAYSATFGGAEYMDDRFLRPAPVDNY